MKSKLLKLLIMALKSTFYGALLLTVFYTSITASEIRQKIESIRNVSLDAKIDDVQLSDVFHLIESKTPFTFAYDNVDLQQDIRINFNKKKATVADVLLEVSKVANLKFRQVNDLINVNVMEKKDKGQAIEVLLQAIAVTGRVTSSDDPDGLPGVNVIVKGTTQGTVTDIDGNYKIDVPSGESALVFSSVGYQKEEVAVGNRTVIDMVLSPDIKALQEIVVVGYGEQKKVTLTGSVGSIKSEDLTLRPVANTTELLQGQVAGLITRQTSGLPGADGTTLSIRGYGTPLILIDGIEGALAQIDPNDIESISVLKDASAAIYGARAGNGVVLVTTKHGTKKAATITYNGTVSMSRPTFLPDLVGARDWAEMLNESGLNPDDYSPANIHYDPQNNTLTNTLDGSEYQGYDWADGLYRDWAPQQQHNLSASGGNENVKYFISTGYTKQESAFKSGDYDFDRYNIRSNIDANITKNIGVSVDFSYRSTLLDKANFGVSDMYNSLQTAKPVFPYINTEDPTKATYSGFLQRSPYYQTFKDYSGFIQNKQNTLQGAIELRYNFPFVKGLTAKARLNYQETYSWNKNVSKPFDVYEYDAIKAQDGSDPWIKRGTQNTNHMSVYADRGTELLPQFSLAYDRSFGNHNLKAVLVSETQTYKWTSLDGSRKDILSYEAPYLIYASNEGKDNGENLKTNGDIGTTQTARSSVIGRVNYNYMEKYMFEFAMRADASAEYPPSGRWGYFPSISAGWRISEEPFMKHKFRNLDNLKLRASYGILGNDAVSSFDYLSGYNITPNYYIFGTTPAPEIESAGLANPDITWETMTMYDVGLDGSWWQGKLSIELDAFYRLRENILAQPTEQVPTTFGASLPKTNLNKRDNRGFEITVTHQNRIGQFHYDISPKFSWPGENM